MSCRYVVRNDVEQKYRNKNVFEALWLSEKALPYTERKLNQIDKVLNMPEATYESYDAWGQAVRGKPIRAKITISPAQNGYDARERISYFMETRFPDVAHVYKTQPPQETGFVEVEDEELPF